MASKSSIIKKLLFILLILAYPSLVMAVTPPVPAHPSQYVVDLAGVMDAGTRARLNGMLRKLEAKTTAQMVVLTIKSLDGESIESFSHQTAVKWGIGKKGKDNGVLITVAVKDHKYRIEVGYGLEATLPDSLVGSIGRRYLVPHFRKGDYAGGLVAAVTAISKTITGGGGVTPGKTGPQKTGKRVGGLVFLVGFLAVFGLPILFIWMIFRMARKRGWGGGGGGYYGGGWSSGGGWSFGGGSSGFSGGGGDFGGGGASGDW